MRNHAPTYLEALDIIRDHAVRPFVTEHKALLLLCIR